MKKTWSNLLLTLLAAALLLGFAAGLPSPSINVEAYDTYQGLTNE